LLLYFEVGDLGDRQRLECVTEGGLILATAEARRIQRAKTNAAARV